MQAEKIFPGTERYQMHNAQCKNIISSGFWADIFAAGCHEPDAGT
jgi:hypothetical protein